MSEGVAISLRSVSLTISQSLFRKKLDLLAGITLEVGAGEFVGILGPSGAGKSTLLHVLNGDQAPTVGMVTFDGLPAATYLPAQRKSLAYLPQEPPLHAALTPARALTYSARLRGLGSRSRELATAALDQVGVSHRAHTPITKLSGGERKRVALAAELLGEPVALFLDEATSGLDPAAEKEMMELFRRQAQAGRTVVCITHFPDNVSICDKLIVLAGGQLVFHGSPDEVLAAFGIGTISQLYAKLNGERVAPTAESKASKKAATGPMTAPPSRIKVPGVIAQTATLSSRHLRLLALDGRNLLLLLLQAPVIALFIGATFGNIAVDFSEQFAADLKQVAFLLIMAVLWCAGTNGVREIVKERAIFLHESRSGLDEAAYFISKFLPLGALAVVQAFLLLAFLGWITRFAGDWPNHFVVLSLLALAATAIGLCISAAVKTAERAMTFLPIVLIALAVLSGGLARLQGWIRVPAYLFNPAFWTFEGLKATLPSNLTEASFISAPGMYQPLILGRGLPLWLDAAALTIQIAALLFFGIALLRRTTSKF
jgi:ABC-type multidrug transport system ATPase subunit